MAVTPIKIKDESQTQGEVMGASGRNFKHREYETSFDDLVRRDRTIDMTNDNINFDTERER